MLYSPIFSVSVLYSTILQDKITPSCLICVILLVNSNVYVILAGLLTYNFVISSVFSTYLLYKHSNIYSIDAPLSCIILFIKPFPPGRCSRILDFSLYLCMVPLLNLHFTYVFFSFWVFPEDAISLFVLNFR